MVGYETCENPKYEYDASNDGVWIMVNGEHSVFLPRNVIISMLSLLPSFPPEATP